MFFFLRSEIHHIAQVTLWIGLNGRNEQWKKKKIERRRKNKVKSAHELFFLVSCVFFFSPHLPQIHFSSFDYLLPALQQYDWSAHAPRNSPLKHGDEEENLCHGNVMCELLFLCRLVHIQTSSGVSSLNFCNKIRVVGKLCNFFSWHFFCAESSMLLQGVTCNIRMTAKWKIWKRLQHNLEYFSSFLLRFTTYVSLVSFRGRLSCLNAFMIQQI